MTQEKPSQGQKQTWAGATPHWVLMSQPPGDRISLSLDSWKLTWAKSDYLHIHTHPLWCQAASSAVGPAVCGYRLLPAQEWQASEVSIWKCRPRTHSHCFALKSWSCWIKSSICYSRKQGLQPFSTDTFPAQLGPCYSIPFFFFFLEVLVKCCPLKTWLHFKVCKNKEICWM